MLGGHQKCPGNLKFTTSYLRMRMKDNDMSTSDQLLTSGRLYTAHQADGVGFAARLHQPTTCSRPKRLPAGQPANRLLVVQSNQLVERFLSSIHLTTNREVRFLLVSTSQQVVAVGLALGLCHSSPFSLRKEKQFKGEKCHLE